jgi:hypothetical protein
VAGLEGSVLLLVDVFPAAARKQQPQDAFQHPHGIGSLSPDRLLWVGGQDGPDAISLLKRQGQVHDPKLLQGQCQKRQ